MNCSFSDKEEKKYGQLKVKLAQDPSNVALLLELGKLTFVNCLPSKSEELSYLVRAVELDPTNVEAMFWLAAGWYYNWGADTEAKKYLDRALQLEPNHPGCLKLMFYVVHSSTGNWRDGISYLRKAQELEPTWIGGYWQVALLLYDEGKYLEAEQEILTALKRVEDRYVEPEDSVEECYERLITGRTNRQSLELRELLGRIRKKIM